MKYVMNKHGELEVFDSSKILVFIKDAFERVKEDYDQELLEKLQDAVLSKLSIAEHDILTIDLIYDFIEEVYMEYQYLNVLKGFILYRNERNKVLERLSYIEEYDLSFIEHIDYKEEEIVVWDYHDTSDEIYELDVYELFKDGIGELTHIKDLKTFSDILAMKLISYKDYNGIIMLKSFQHTLSSAIKENFIRYYYQYLNNALLLMTDLDSLEVIKELSQLQLKPDIDNLEYLESERYILLNHHLDDGLITHIQKQSMLCAFHLINENTYYYMNAIDDILLSYQECVEEIKPEIRIKIEVPTNIEEKIVVDALKKITGLGE